MYKRKQINRKTELETLEEIIEDRDYYKENSENGLSIIINGSWGSGKTTFVRSFADMIDRGKYEVLDIYNSFEYDFYDNAYIPLFSHIKEGLKLKLDIDKLFNITAKTISKRAMSIAFNTARYIVKTKTGVDFKKLNDEIKSIGKEYNKNYSEYEKFKELKKLKLELKQEILKKSNKKTIILIIDELDRCNPNFAIATLEIIKYFFDIKNLIIILSLDKGQLEESIKTIYGNGIDSDLYFSKFFDYQFNLNRLKFIDAIDFSSIEDAPDIVSSIEHVFSFLNISIRDSYKIFNEFICKYKRYSNETNKWTKTQCVFVLFIIIIKNTDLMFYNSIINGTFNDYEKKILDDDNIDKKKYIDVFSFTLFGESNIKKSILNLIKNRDLKYIETSNLNVTSFDEDRRKELKILKEMYLFLPRVLDNGTYMDNYLKIFNN